MSGSKVESLADSLVEQFSERIRSGELVCDSRMPTEKEIAESAGVSRTVVREALARMAANGLVYTRQGAGAFVSATARYSPFQVTREEMAEVEDVIKLLELRVPLETEMASLAAQRRSSQDLERIAACLDQMRQTDDPELAADADAAFHGAIAAATRNEYYSRFTQFLGVRLVPSRTMYLRDEPLEAYRAYAAALEADHLAIFAAIRGRDALGAGMAARYHMMQSLERHAQLRAKHDVSESK